MREHACLDGPGIAAHIVDWDKFLPRFDQFKAEEKARLVKHGSSAVAPDHPRPFLRAVWTIAFAA